MTSLTRVQIPAYIDRWMMGDRFGTLLEIKGDIARVQLDISRKIVRVKVDDCRFY